MLTIQMPIYERPGGADSHQEEELRAAARLIACPRCGAQPYTPCQKRGQFQRGYHAERLNAVQGGPTKENREHWQRRQYLQSRADPALHVRRENDR
jgi:hypothetical protein